MNKLNSAEKSIVIDIIYAYLDNEHDKGNSESICVETLESAIDNPDLVLTDALTHLLYMVPHENNIDYFHGGLNIYEWEEKHIVSLCEKIDKTRITLG